MLNTEQWGQQSLELLSNYAPNSSSYSVFIRCFPFSRDGRIYPIPSAISRTPSLHLSRLRAGVAKLFMQSANSSTNPCRMRHKCRAGVANLFSPCAKIFRHTSIHLKMRHTNIHSFSLLRVVIYLYFEVKTRPYSAVISEKKKKKKRLKYATKREANQVRTFFFFFLEMLLEWQIFRPDERTLAQIARKILNLECATSKHAMRQIWRNAPRLATPVLEHPPSSNQSSLSPLPLASSRSSSVVLAFSCQSLQDLEQPSNPPPPNNNTPNNNPKYKPPK